MIITLTTKTKYDLSKKDDFDKLRKYMSVSSSRKKLAELRNIQAQVANYLDNERARIIYKKAGIDIANLDKRDDVSSSVPPMNAHRLLTATASKHNS